MNLLSEDHVLQTYDGEGREVSTMVAGEDNMLKRIDYFVVRRKGSQSVLYSRGIELEERHSLKRKVTDGTSCVIHGGLGSWIWQWNADETAVWK